MNEKIIQKLLHINQEFYQRFGEAFAETRRRIQPGVDRVLSEFVKNGDWLDLGCGSGWLAVEWLRAGRSGVYWGLDFSPELLAEAEAQIRAQDGFRPEQFHFRLADLGQEVTSSKELAEKMRAALYVITGMFSVPAAALFAYDPQRKALTLLALARAEARFKCQ